MTGNILIQVLFFALVVTGTLVLGLATSWIDRKVTARVHARIGPPWYQPVADILKLMGKETLVPNEAGRAVFLTAPLVGLAGAALAAALLGAVITGFGDGFIGDLVVLVYLLMIPAIAVIIGASASGNTQAAVGASRETKLVLGYELPFLIAVISVIVRAGYTLRLGGIVAAQTASGWFLLSISGVIAFVVMLLSTQAKLGLVPFDTAEAEQEIMGGTVTEYSGPPLAVIKLSKTILLAVMPLLIVTLLMGGVRPEGWGILWGILKYVGIIVLVVLIRNTNPRVRIDQAVRFFWGPMTVLAAIGLVLAFVGL